MSNSTGSVKVVLSIPGPGGATIAVSASILPVFSASSIGEVDVPDTTASATAFAIPFGSVAVGAGFVLIHNLAGQDMVLKVNGSAALNNVPDDAWVMVAHPLLPTASKLTAVSLTTTATVAGAGKIEFWVLGDQV